MQTFRDCVELKTHGYLPEYNFNVVSIPEQDFLDEDQTRARIGPKVGEYELFRKRFFGIQQETDKTIDYCFLVNYTPPLSRAKKSVKVRIFDSAGEDVVSANSYGGDAPVRSEESIERLNAAVADSDSLVIVLPLVDGLAEGQYRDLLEVVRAYADAPRESKRIVVAFNQYERLFVRVGRLAYVAATTRRVMIKVIKDALRLSDMSDLLLNFSSGSGNQVYFVTTSSYGFVKGLGIPNIDPHSYLSSPDEGQVIMGKASNDIRKYWNPFLVADPFLCAALDVPSTYCLTFADLAEDDRLLPSAGNAVLDGGTRARPARAAHGKADSAASPRSDNTPRPHDGARGRPNFIGKALSFFNKNRDDDG